MTTIGRTTSTPERLTPRQREVLELLRRGDTNEEIARSLGISLDGAKWHVSEIIGRLGVTDRYEAARWRPEGERRPWWSLAWFRDLGWPTAAKATSVAALAIVTIAIIALTWGIWRGNDDKASIAPASPPVPRMMVLSVSADGGAIAVDTDTGGVTQRLDVKDVGGWISPDGTRSAFTCAEYPAANTRATDPAWCMWDSATGLSVAVSRSELARRGLLEDGNGGPNFVWSADGTKFAFFVYQGAGVSVNNSVDVYVKDLLSGDLRMVHQATLTQGRRRFIGFSPDGKHIGMYDGPASLLIIDIDTNAEHILSDALAIGAGQLRFGSAAWSPDSRTIAFVVNQGLYVAFADGSSPALRIAGEWAPGWLEWSPDGHWIAATRVNEERDPVVFSHAVIVRPDGTDERDIDGNLALSSYPSWSPKSGQVAFSGSDNAESPDGNKLYVADLDPSSLRSINIGAPLAPYPIIAWSADGERLFYTAASAPCSSECFEPGYLYMSNADGSSTPRKLYDQPVAAILGWTE